MFDGLFLSVSEKDKTDAISRVVAHSSPRSDFFLLVVLSVIVAAFGVILNSVVILIGSMLIAPILYPLLSLALGIITADRKLIGRSVSVVLQSLGISLAAAFVIGIAFTAIPYSHASVLSLVAGGQPSLIYFIVAVIAGFAAAYTMARPNLNEALPGVAVSVALVPPLAVAGVALAHLDLGIFWSGLILFVANVAGILFAGMVVFSLLGLAVKQKAAEAAIHHDEAEIKRVEAKVEAEKEKAAA